MCRTKEDLPRVRACTGGSAANSAKTLAALSDTTQVSFVGMIGPDQQGRCDGVVQDTWYVAAM